MAADRILIIRLSSFGDILLSTPLIRQIRKKFPDTVIDFAVRGKFSGILTDNPHLNNLHILQEPADFGTLKDYAERIKSVNYDIVIDIHKNFRSKYISSKSGADIYTWRLPRVKRWLLVNLKWNMLTEYPPVPLRYLSAVEELGVADDGEGLEFFFSDDSRQKAETIHRDKNIQKSAVLAPGSRWFTKQWGVEKYIEIGKKLLNSNLDSIIILGSKDEQTICHDVCIGIGEHCYNFAGETDFDLAGALIAKSDVFIGNDSGLGHLAAAVKTPSVIIFGCTVKEFGFFLFRNKSVVLEANAKCRPCSHIGRSSCPKKHFKCMENISVDDCLKAVRNFFSADE